MEEVKLLWTYNEFKAYVLIYAAESNQVITDEEKDFIEDQFDSLIINAMKKEFDNDNDYERIQKIMAFIEQNNLGKKDLDSLLNEVKSVYMSDGKFDTAEQAVFEVLEKLFKLKLY